ncbi:nuclear transport factor 2 family protein [Mucilaginibacter aquariorum]|uniref:Nuclear transport factor 2 family protein n=1 Tax=Mucilaginibacter aquariorum TaxID=2967225 RepID=A0ABT1T8E4_9SPHI|nr:nuclear transport factor 2 family protein [Mucilaginibacter aquariorum]MCQ6960712.1 nuclear transport factor 2 family protein [Mucilaginibacter aquariorum]
MSNYADNATAVAAVLSNYFNGIFKGDVELLRSTFHPQALVVGDVKGQPYFKSLDQYLDGVKNRKSPFELGETIRMEILSVEIINSIAIAKAHVPMFDFNYYDLLSLNKIDGAWVIVNKLLTHVSV